MTQVTITKKINVPANDAWQKIAQFSGIEDYSPIAKSTVEGNGVGAKRVCYMPDDSEIHESLSVLDHANMHLEYDMHSGPFPVRDYKGIISVKPVNDNNCKISWGSVFQLGEVPEDKIRPLFEGFYNEAIEGLEQFLNKQ